VVLLEKAWAKVHGGYLNIEGGRIEEALRDLTGASVKNFFTNNNPDALWEKLMEAESKEFIMSAGTDDLSGGSDVYISEIGICGSHAYSMLAVYQLKSVGGYYVRSGLGEQCDVKLVKLRNPWGEGE
jgi:calpain